MSLFLYSPRDSSSFSRHKNSRSFHGTAESAIEFLQNQSMVKKINIYHFKSTAIVTIKIFSKVKLYDILADVWWHGRQFGFLRTFNIK